MKPRIKLSECKTVTNETMTLYEHDGSYGITLNGRELMNSRSTYSELLLGSVGVENLHQGDKQRVLIGGLGLGYTLKSVLEKTDQKTEVEVAELVAEVIEWNLTHLKSLNGALLENQRVKIQAIDIKELIQKAEPNTYDAIMLDIDNGPVAMVQEGNQYLYTRKGIRSTFRALKDNGRLAVWSASIDSKFEQQLKRNGASFHLVRAKANHKAKRASYVIYVIEPRQRH